MLQPDQLVEELPGVLRFEQVAACAAFDRFEQVVVIAGHCQHHDLDLGKLGFDQPGGAQPIAARHLDIHQDHFRAQAARFFERFKAVPRRSKHLDPMGAEQVFQPIQK